MRTITAILEPDADGSLHLPLPAELGPGKIKVVTVLAAMPPEGTPAQSGTAREWARRARGSVRLAPGETTDEARMSFYAEKYGVKP